MTMRELVETLVKALVDNPDQVNVRSTEGEMSSLLEIEVCKKDVCLVIGRHGNTIQAIRAILNSIAAKGKKRVLIDVLE